MAHSSLNFGIQMPIQASNAGFFVSRGVGTHPDRVIQTFELIYVKEGCLSMQEADQAFDVHEGETLLLWPGRRHLGLRPYPPELSFYWVHFGLRDLPQDEFTLTVPQYASVGRPDHLTLLFRRLLDDQATFGIDPLSSSLTVLMMLQEVAGSSPARMNSNSSAALLAGRADGIIRSRFHEPLTAGSIAAELHCHPDYLGRVYRQIFNLTLTGAIHRRRLHQARILLLESTDAVDVVARRCGFDEIGYFRRLFKRQEGLSPRAFRHIYARMHVNTD